MKDEKEIQTAWELLNLIEKLDQLLWERYEDDFIDINPYEQQDPCLGPLGPLGMLDSQDKTGG
jgi:hypothetical protein